MSPAVILGSLIVTPILVIVLLRVNAALVFLSLCLGNVLVQFVDDDAAAIAAGAAQNMQAVKSYVTLGLLLLPAVLTLLVMIRTVHGKSKRIFNFLPATGVGLLTALLVAPLLPSGLSYSLMHNNIWEQLSGFRSAIVAMSALICLLFLWLQRPKHISAEAHAKK